MNVTRSNSTCSEAMHGLPELPAASPAALVTVSTHAKTPRVVWSESETMVLINLWEKHFDDLRRQKRNGAVYLEISRGLRASGYVKNKKQVHSKIENMTQMYRKWTKQGATELNMPSWPFYLPIHRFLGKVKPKPASGNALQAQVTSTIQAQCGQELQDMEEAMLPDPSEPKSSLPVGAHLSAESTHTCADARVKMEPTDGNDMENGDAAVSDTSSVSVPWPVQGNNSDASEDWGNLHKPPLPFTSELIEPASPSVTEMLRKILDEQRQLRRTIEKSNQRRHELMLRQTRLQERVTKALVQITTSIKSCCKESLSSP